MEAVLLRFRNVPYTPSARTRAADLFASGLIEGLSTSDWVWPVTARSATLPLSKDRRSGHLLQLASGRAMNCSNTER